MQTPEFMTAEEMEARFDGEWVVIDSPEQNDVQEVLNCLVVFHSADYEAAYAAALRLTSPSSAFYHIGASKSDFVYVLGPLAVL